MIWYDNDDMESSKRRSIYFISLVFILKWFNKTVNTHKVWPNKVIKQLKVLNCLNCDQKVSFSQ